jgi:hypothetical protein
MENPPKDGKIERKRIPSHYLAHGLVKLKQKAARQAGQGSVGDETLAFAAAAAAAEAT